MFDSSASARPPRHGGLSRWAGLGMLCVYAAVAPAVDCWVLVRRDG